MTVTAPDCPEPSSRIAIGRGARAIVRTPASGEPRARGSMYGAALAPLVHDHISRWLESLARAGLGEPRAYVRRMLAETDFLTAIRAFVPDLLEELHGVAEGAGADFDLVYGLQLLDEEWAYRERRATGGKLEKCSSVAIAAPGGPTWIGQTMDLGAYTDGSQALLAIEGDDRSPDALLFTTAGMIGLMGVNDAGLGVCVNSLPQLGGAPEGVPVAFVIRRLLQCGSVAEASELVQRLPHATNQHYVLADLSAVRSFEASAAGVTEYRPPSPDRVLHTNHPLTEVQGRPETDQARANSVARLKSLQGRLGEGAPDAGAIKAALSSRDDPANPVCRIPDEDAGLIGFTTGSMVSEIGPADITCWVSPGPPSERGYSRFELARRA
jgi:isopenicillin-N N-acyltransferase-like protein